MLIGALIYFGLIIGLYIDNSSLRDTNKKLKEKLGKCENDLKTSQKIRPKFNPKNISIITEKHYLKTCEENRQLRQIIQQHIETF